MLPRRRIIDGGAGMPAGCVLALDAASLGLADGAAVASWPASVGAFAPAQATGANQPTFVASASNGQPGVQFNGTSQFLTCASDATLRPADNWAAVAAVILPASFAATPFLFGVDPAGFASTSLYFNTAGRLGFENRNTVGNQSLAASGMTALTTGAKALLEIHFTGGQVEYWVNGALADTQTASGPALKTDGSSGLAIGSPSSAGGQLFGGTLLELRIYAQTRKMRAADHVVLQKRLNAKWGLY